jgi:hypothetical protein
LSTDASPPTAERLLLKADHVYRWRGRTRGQTFFRTYLGTLLLTNVRFVFLSSGGTDVWRRMAWAGLFAGLSAAPGTVGKAATLSDATTTVLGWISQRFGTTAGSRDLEVSSAQLLKDGSLSVPLHELEDFGFVARRLSNFFWVAYTSTDGTRQEYTFSGQVALPGGWAWETLIREIRESGQV